jgi:hypothetical protein
MTLMEWWAGGSKRLASQGSMRKLQKLQKGGALSYFPHFLHFLHPDAALGVSTTVGTAGPPSRWYAS